MQHQLDPASPLSPHFTDAVEGVLREFLASQAPLVEHIGATPLMRVAESFTAGGKRLRPAFAFWGYVAAAGLPMDSASLLRAAASLDLLHVSALVHDDIIDASDTRRGMPAAHVYYADQHTSRGGINDPRKFGDAAAILLGDLLLMWSGELFDDSGLPEDALRQALPLLHAMRTEVAAGQYLDVAASFDLADAVTIEEQIEVSRRILEYKSARYSVMRPAQIGASLGGADDALLAALHKFGSALGHAFQLRDDVLGIYGAAEVTGKPEGGDITEGKRTLLVLTALQRGNEAQRATIGELLGSPLDAQQVDTARAVIRETGALEATEQAIAADLNTALRALDEADVTEEGHTALSRLAELAVHREH